MKTLKHYRWVILWSLLLLALSGFPGQTLVQLFSWKRLFSFDKLGHASMYLVQMLLLALAIRQHQPAFTTGRVLGLAFTVCFSFGGLMEILQSFVFVDRSGEWTDIAANTMGCLAATPFYFLYQRAKRVNK